MYVVINQAWNDLNSLNAGTTKEAAYNRAVRMIAALTGGKVRLCTSPFLPNYSTTLVDLEAVEIDYSNYTAGGAVISAPALPLFDPTGGAAITAEVSFTYSDAVDPALAGIASSGWIEDSTGLVLTTFTLPNPVTFAALGDGLVLHMIETQGRSAPLSV